jgi:hypothetical protein
MVRTVATLPAGGRITGYISRGVKARTLLATSIRPALVKTPKASVRQRDLPADVVVCYVIALSLYAQSSYREVFHCLLAGIQWPRDPSVDLNAAGRTGISQARA